MLEELNKAFEDNQKVWERVLQVPRHLSKFNPAWFSQGLGLDDEEE